MEVDYFASQLRSVPASVAQVVVDLPESRLRARPRAGEWSAIEVVGHLIDRYESPALPLYDQDECVRVAHYQTVDLTTLLGALMVSAERFARAVVEVGPQAFGRRGMHSEYGLITLRQCLSLPLDSVSGHLRQMRDVAASAVG